MTWRGSRRQLLVTQRLRLAEGRSSSRVITWADDSASLPHFDVGWNNEIYSTTYKNTGCGNAKFTTIELWSGWNTHTLTVNSVCVYFGQRRCSVASVIENRRSCRSHRRCADERCHGSDYRWSTKWERSECCPVAASCGDIATCPPIYIF